MSNINEKIGIRRFMVDGVEHHVHQDRKEEFESIVNSAGKKLGVAESRDESIGNRHIFKFQVMN